MVARNLDLSDKTELHIPGEQYRHIFQSQGFVTGKQ